MCAKIQQTMHLRLGLLALFFTHFFFHRKDVSMPRCVLQVPPNNYQVILPECEKVQLVLRGKRKEGGQEMGRKEERSEHRK